MCSDTSPTPLVSPLATGTDAPAESRTEPGYASGRRSPASSSGCCSAWRSWAGRACGRSSPEGSVDDGVHAVGHEVRCHHEPDAHDLVAVPAAGATRGDATGHHAREVRDVVTGALLAVELLGA